jgi:hypothetical protein
MFDSQQYSIYMFGSALGFPPAQEPARLLAMYSNTQVPATPPKSRTDAMHWSLQRSFRLATHVFALRRVAVLELLELGAEAVRHLLA